MHWTGTPGMLQARGREIAKVLLIGILKGTLAVTRRHKQSMPLLVSDLRAPQHSVVGEVPLALLPVRKPIQGVKRVLIVEGLHGVLICALAGPVMTILITNIIARWHKATEFAMSNCVLGICTSVESREVVKLGLELEVLRLC